MANGERVLGWQFCLSSLSLAGLAEVQKCVQHSVDIVVDISILDTIDAVPLTFQVCGSHGITLLLVFRCVSSTIDFNNDLELSAKEIHEEGADRRLPNELQSAEPSSTKLLPKSGFR